MFPHMKRIALLFALVFPATIYAADYTYQQTTQLTGGSLLHMMKSVGFISSQARHMGDPVVSTIYLKDNRLANVSAESIEIIDLDKETITHIDVQKKTYTVMTFDQMKQAMANAREQMEKQKASQPAAQPAPDPNAENVKMSFDVKVHKTGAQKEISGLQSSEAILTMTMTATDTKSQQSGNMAITNDMWMVPEIPGYDQVRDFYKRMALKMADATHDWAGLRLQQDAGAESRRRTGPWRHGEGDAEARRRSDHAGDAHGHNYQWSTVAGSIGSSNNSRTRGAKRQ